LKLYSRLNTISTSFDKERCVMRPSVALDLKRGAIREAASRYRTANPRVFGSVLHGTDEDGSDQLPAVRRDAEDSNDDGVEP
jgi:hypothetical protein